MKYVQIATHKIASLVIFVVENATVKVVVL